MMTVTRLEIRSRTPYEGGRVFGDTGAYERLDGVIHFAVDPNDVANGAIVDLDKAARAADGRVHYEADFCLLQPADASRANRRLLYEVPNRGNRGSVRAFNYGPPLLDPTEAIDPGDGYLMKNGWTLAWCGWQWDVPRGPGQMGIDAPQALENGRPIPGELLIRIQPAAPARSFLLTDHHTQRVHKPYPAADLHDPTATLTVRARPDDPRMTIPRERWRFARDDGGAPVSDDTSVWLEGGFEAGRIYEVVYRTRICPVAGVGLLAMRDTVALLRYGGPDAGNPSAGRIDYAYGTGTSQCGRYLRTYLCAGLNRDEAGRRVFDGLLIHVAGARRGEFNHRYAQPSVQPTPSFGHLPPFTDDEQTDPLTGRSDGLLRRQRAIGDTPRIISTNTAAEYWRGDAALAHIDMTGTRDLALPPESRAYLFAGAQHGAGALPLNNRTPLGVHGAHPFNVIDYRPLQRAALVNLDRWVSRGEEPPPSAVPRLADGTATTLSAAVAAFPAIPGATRPAPAGHQAMRRLDLGPDADKGIGRYPPIAGEPYPSFVSAINADGNELAGIRLPEVAAPVATYTGWNPRHASTGGAGQLLDYQGSTLPFAATEGERDRTGDPRPSIATRYRDRDDYTARARAVATQLAAQRYILEEDIDVVTANAVARYDAIAATPARA
ncbi:MAG: alpha/beta hydrolase domain-containing protein [Dehalococcoidia bacterium]